MKKFISLAISMAMVIFAFSQSIPTVDQSMLEQSRKAVYVPADDVIVEAPVQELTGPRAFDPSETIIGETWYDLQTNKSVQNRVYRYADGTIGAVWTRGIDASAFPDRGTGYNYYDGTEWGPSPTTRIESIRCGWPSYSPLGPDGELVISHDFGASVLYFNEREVKGTGSWIETTYVYSTGPPALSWPRHITSGPDNNNIHLMVNSVDEYMGMAGAQVYSRSTDGGESWDIENMIIDGMGVDDYLELAADEVVWADAVGDNIAFLVMDMWHDMFMMKSTDNGENWEKTVIWEHPYPFFDWNVTITDTFFCMDKAASIALGPDGKAHVVFGISRIAHFDVGTTYNFWPFVEGIGYWNEDMDPFSNDVDALAPPQYGYANSEMLEDVNYIGWMQDVDGDGEVTLIGTGVDDIMTYRTLGPCTMPTITVDDANRVFVLFSATTETYHNDTYNYKHIWARGMSGGVWYEFLDLTSNIVHIFDESIYPQLTSSSDDNIHYIYNADLTPGLALDEDHAYEENRQYYAMLPTPDLIPVGIEEITSGSGAITVSQNFPNPVSTFTTFRVELEEAAELSMELINITGQVVMTQNKGFVNTGLHEFRIDASELGAGTYFYTVNAGDSRVTKRMLVR